MTVIAITHFFKRLLFFDRKQRFFLQQRFQNQMHCYDYPPENLGWKKYGSVPVYGNTGTGTVFDPCVLIHDNLFLMTASERKSGSLILLSSVDGIHWKKQSLLLSAKPNSWEHIVNRGNMLLVEGTWHLWYTGQETGVSKIGHLISSNFKEFVRTKDNQPVMEATIPAEGVSVMNPCVLWDRDRKIFRMWYAAGENYEPDAIFYAESKDGDHWEKRSEPVLAKDEAHEWEKYKVGGCDVKRMSDGRYIMFYIGYQNLDVARICYALSSDGISWKRPDDNLVIAPSRESWDADAVYKPAFVERNGEQFLWYNGRSGTDEYIGLAKRTV